MSHSLYLTLCVLACIAPIALVLVSIGTGLPPESDAAFAAIGLLLAAVLTYPAGVVGTVFCMILILAGLVTPTEAIALSAPIFAGAGYLQWYVILPKVYGGKDRGSGSTRSPDSPSS